MIYIAHRGNLTGPNPEKENHPEYLMEAVAQGWAVEVDVWVIDRKIILGHDAPQYEVKEEFILNDSFWHHAKNIQAFYKLNRMRPNYLINCFYHDKDDAVLTSGGWLWTYPGKELTPDSIAVLPERVVDWEIGQAYGICTDFVEMYRAKLG